MFGLGDITAQSVVESRKPQDIDWLRTLRYVSIGCAVGPSLSMWYRTLDKFGTENKVSTVAKKIMVDQLIASPIVNGTVMIMSRVFSGDEWPQIQKKLDDNYVTVMLNSYFVNAFFSLPCVVYNLCAIYNLVIFFHIDMAGCANV